MKPLLKYVTKQYKYINGKKHAETPEKQSSSRTAISIGYQYYQAKHYKCDPEVYRLWKCYNYTRLIHSEIVQSTQWNSKFTE